LTIYEASNHFHRFCPSCAACGQSLEQHTYRFFASHPARPGTSPFVDAIRVHDWAAVYATQAPAVNQPLLVVHAIACPASGGGMMLTALQSEDAPDAALFDHAVLTAQELAAVRTLCPTCRWLPIGPAAERTAGD